MPVERRLVVRQGDHVREVLLVGTVTVGRSPSCEISSPDSRLSRAHAVFAVVGDDVVVRDLESRNGTRVNGEKITEHLLAATDLVEVGPFALQLVEIRSAPPLEPGQATDGDDEATVLRPRRAKAAAAASPAPAAAGTLSAPTPADDADVTRRQARPPVAATPVATSPAPTAPAPGFASTPRRSEGTAGHPPPPAASRPAPSSELTFAHTTLLWVVPLALVSFLAGLVPDLLQPDERTPLLQAHYQALAQSAVELVRISREPALPLDRVTSALRRHAGVVHARVTSADGRVLAPLDEAGTSVVVPPLTGAALRVADTDAGFVELHVATSTGDDRPVVVALTIDPSSIHPAPAGSAMGTLLLLVCLGAAWLVTRRMTGVANARLLRLGEEVELMTTRQVSVGHEHFGLPGGQRILDAVAFALSPAGRHPGDAPIPNNRPEGGSASHGLATATATETATIEADAGFRIIAADAGCETLLGLAPEGARGQHLIDALHDQAVVDEVLRLVTEATPEQAAQGAAAPSGRPYRLGIDVTRGRGGAPLVIRFKRM